MKNIIIVLSFLLFSTFLFSQENKITVSPSSLESWSSISVVVAKKGIYNLKIINSKGKEMLKKELEISDRKIFGFKYNFRNFKKGNYSFELIKNDSIVAKSNIQKIKKDD